MVVRGLLLGVCALHAVAQRPIVDTASLGRVAGVTLPSGAEVFRGLRYATAARFAPAELYSEKNTGTAAMDASSFGPCVQFIQFTRTSPVFFFILGKLHVSPFLPRFCRIWLQGIRISVSHSRGPPPHTAGFGGLGLRVCDA